MSLKALVHKIAVRPLILVAAASVLLALPATAGAAEPWWQVLSGSRPSNLQPAPDTTEVQLLSAAKTSVPGGYGNILVATIEIGGKPVGCLGAGANAAAFCPLETGFEATETVAGLRELLEASYGAEMQLSGPANVDEGPITVTTPGRWVPAISLDPVGAFIFGFTRDLGKASAEVTSEGSGRLVATLTNLGNASVDATEVPLTITDELPENAVPYDTLGEAGWHTKIDAGNVHVENPLPCEVPFEGPVRCSFEGKLRPYESIEVEVLVALKGDAADGEAGTVAVAGGRGPAGEAAPAAEAAQTLHVSSAPVPFGLEYFSTKAEGPHGEEASQAGAHPFQLTTTVVATSGPQEGTTRGTSAHVAQPALPRNLRFTLPAGLVGDVTAVPTCDLATFLFKNVYGINECRDDAAIGVSAVTIQDGLGFGLARITVPVFNLPAEQGEPARFGLMIAGVPVLIDTSVDPADSYRITAEVRNIPQTVEFLASTTTLWGVPGAPAHDESRGWNCAYTANYKLPGECKKPLASERSEAPFLRLPVSCAFPLDYGAAFEPWNSPIGSVVDRASSAGAPLGACNHEPFDPGFSLAPTSHVAAAATGVEAEVAMPNSGLANPAEDAVSEAQFKRAEAILPEGMAVNPSAAEGLAVCSEADYGRETVDSRPGDGCPEASKIGTVRISTPLLEEEAEGSLYQAAPYENPTGGMLAVYLVARIPARGVIVKQVGQVEPDARTGQLKTTFDDIPQLPFSSFKLRFREGGRAPLITPPACGTFHTVIRFVPWSARNPQSPDPSEVVERTAPFTIERGPNGGDCPAGAAPFNPGFEAGTESNQAGSYSPFDMHLTRSDGEQDMGKFSFVLPPGVVPRLAGIPYCSDAQIAQARSRTGAHGGQEELDSPSCPAASEIGRTVAGAGVGDQLTYVGGKLYLAGPYNGDPISAVSITPAVAGPFDAGTVVVREALRLNPVTHVGEVDGSASDPIPHILKGIPLNLRDLRVYADKPEFTLNPTSCEPFEAKSTIWGDGTAVEPLAEHPVDLTSRFQAAGCASLGFKPKLGLRLKGGTRRGAFPALHAAYVPRKHGDANLSRLALTFPNSEFIEQGHFRTICTRVQFAAGAGFGSKCPKGSIYGHIKVWTPLLSEPLAGPIYLRSSNHNLPDAVFALHGLVDIEVAVRIDSKHGRLRATVANSPDAPVSRAVVRMQGGQKGLFVNSRNLCSTAKRNRARVGAKGQNGRQALLRPLMRAVKCGKAKRKRHGRHSRRKQRAPRARSER